MSGEEDQHREPQEEQEEQVEEEAPLEEEEDVSRQGENNPAAEEEAGSDDDEEQEQPPLKEGGGGGDLKKFRMTKTFYKKVAIAATVVICVAAATVLNNLQRHYSFHIIVCSIGAFCLGWMIFEIRDWERMRQGYEKIRTSSKNEKDKLTNSETRVDHLNAVIQEKTKSIAKATRIGKDMKAIASDALEKCRRAAEEAEQ